MNFILYTPESIQAAEADWLKKIAASKAKQAQVEPAWETPAHDEINLAKVCPEDFGIDSDSEDPLVKAIYRASAIDAAIPDQFKQKQNWVRWRLEEVGGKLTKVPYQLNGKKASSTDPSTWNTFDHVFAGATINQNEGIGIMTDGTFIGWDLDGCRNPKTGEIKEWATQIINLLSAYTEVTPSRTGVRIYTLGKLHDNAKHVFDLALTAGYGDKVKIETYDHARYFAVTGDRIGQSGLVPTDTVKAYELCDSISREYPSEKRKAAAGFKSVDSGSSVAFTPSGTVLTSKFAVLMYGKVVSRSPFVIEDEHGNKVTAPSQSEADMSLVTLLAMKHDGNAELIDSDFRESALYRPKWDRLAEPTIKKAVESAKKTAEKVAAEFTFAPTAQAQADAAVSRDAEEFSFGETIPEFDPSVITGIFRDIVELATRQTTIPPQFPFLAAKVYLGARMAGKTTFQGMGDTDSSYYGTAIGETGTSKGESWRRTFETILNPPTMNQTLKVIHSADSGAGLKDVFFDPPDINMSVVCYVDEAASLGHKADGKKNPEILDTIIELADSHHFSRVKAKHGKQKASKTHDNARLSVFMCGQDGTTFMSAFAGRTKLGMFDRLYPEFATPIEAGMLDRVPQADIDNLHAKLLQLKFNVHMTMAPETESQLEKFWQSQPGDIRRKIRYRKHLMLDMYMAAFGRGVTVAQPEDLTVAIKIFNRQIIIRRVCFTGEVPDRVGFFAARIKAIIEAQRRELNRGKTFAQVAKSLRDFQTLTNAFRDNELHTFERAWRSFSEHVTLTDVTGANGQSYKKWVPIPYEHESWNSGGSNPSAVK